MSAFANLPQPKLGNVTAITISSPDLETSLKFYQLLGFKESQRMDFPFPWIMVTDGQLQLMLRKDTQKYQALTYYIQNDDVVKKLESDGISFFMKPGANDVLKRWIIESPDGMKVSLILIPMGFEQLPGPDMLKLSQQDWMNPEKYSNQHAGMFGEYACPVSDIGVSIKFWNKLGFAVLSKYEQPKPWGILSDGLSVVGLHQQTHFTVPTLTFFAKDMKQKIENLKAAGITEFREVMGAANVAVTTPEGQQIFLFSL